MIRLFLQLFTPLFIVTILYIFNLNFLLDPLFNFFLRNNYGYEYEEVVHLLDDSIDSIHSVRSVDRKEKLKQLQEQFQFEINLLDKQDLDLPDRKKKILEQGGFVSETDEIDIFYHLSSHLGRVWKLHLEQGDNEGDHEYIKRVVAGPFQIIVDRLLVRSVDEWEQELASISLMSGLPLTLLTITTVEIESQDLSNLINQGSVVKIENYLTQLYMRINESNLVLQIGPLEHPLIVRYANQVVVGVLGVLMGGAVWLLLRPVWLDLRKLQSASRKFGEGKLQTRIKYSKRSPIKKILQAFNGMAAHIQNLIASHKELPRAVSHELRTPVSRLRFSLEMLEKTNDKTAGKRYLQEMNTDIDELDDMLSELLSYARMERNRELVKYTPVILADWLNEHTAYLKRNCNQKAVRVTHTGLPLHPSTCMDPKLMARALNNLVQNACRYAEQQVHIELSHHNGTFQLRVDDDGPGIPSENHDKIFEPFVRVDSSRDRDSGGYGLGLAIVQQIVEAHQGRVEVMVSKLGGAGFLISWKGSV